MWNGLLKKTSLLWAVAHVWSQSAILSRIMTGEYRTAEMDSEPFLAELLIYLWHEADGLSLIFIWLGLKQCLDDRTRNAQQRMLVLTNRVETWFICWFVKFRHLCDNAGIQVTRDVISLSHLILHIHAIALLMWISEAVLASCSQTNSANLILLYKKVVVQ